MGVVVKRINVQVEGFPSTSPVLRIAHLSDFHMGFYVTRGQVRRAVEAANEGGPDLIALTGDYVTDNARFVRPIGDALSRLRARLGVYAVLGNHDQRAGAGEVTRGLSAVGIRVLNNENRLLELPGASAGPGDAHFEGKDADPVRFALVGVDDLSEGQADLAKAMGGVPEGVPAVVLSHNPDVVYPLQKRPGTLILSGHTHGGQFLRLGRFLLQGTRFGKRHIYGLHRLGKAQVYITSGIGTTFLPIRLLCPAEVADLHVTGVGEEAALMSGDRKRASVELPDPVNPTVAICVGRGSTDASPQGMKRCPAC